jgi:dolichol-phosphate mannosyltransferase
MDLQKSLIIIPTYEEAENIGKILKELFTLYPHINILVIDDNSPDGTSAIVTSKQTTFPNLSLIKREKKLGLGSAYIEALKWAFDRHFDYILCMDCDFSHSPHEAIKLLEEATTNDLVIGSRYIDGIRVVNWPFRRLALSYGASLFSRLITGLPIKDSTGGFRCFKRSTLESIAFENIMSTGHIFQLEFNYRVWIKGLTIKEIPITFHQRKYGHSKMNSKAILEAIYTVIHLRFLKAFGKLA